MILNRRVEFLERALAEETPPHQIHEGFLCWRRVRVESANVTEEEAVK